MCHIGHPRGHHHASSGITPVPSHGRIATTSLIVLIVRTLSEFGVAVGKGAAVSISALGGLLEVLALYSFVVSLIDYSTMATPTSIHPTTTSLIRVLFLKGFLGDRLHLG